MVDQDEDDPPERDVKVRAICVFLAFCFWIFLGSRCVCVRILVCAKFISPRDLEGWTPK